jgi:hypothetical protein
MTFNVTDSDSPAQSSTASLTLSIAAAAPPSAPLAIATTALPGGQVGKSYSAMLAGSGGTAPLNWSIVGGSLPGGLSLNAATGSISGTPTVAGNSAVTVKLTDSASPAQSATVNLALTIAPAPLTIATTSLPKGQTGSSYSAMLAGSGGTAPLHWSIAGGSLPNGLSLNTATGSISGTPTVSGNSAITVKLTDSDSPTQSATANLALTIAPAPLAITTTSLPKGQAGSSYSAMLVATGGTPPLTWAITGGTLPPGLTLNPSTGALSGTPTAAANATLTVKIVDSGSPAQSATANLALTVAPAPLAITTKSLPNGRVGSSYSATLLASGGTTPLTWSIVSGALPAGLSLSAGGSITGTPTAAANQAPLTVQVQDSGNPVQQASASLTITVNPSAITLSISPARAALAVRQMLSMTATTNDTAGVTWSSAPAGGSISPMTSTTGASVTFTAPASAGVYTVTATSVTDTSQSSSVTIGVTDLPGVYTYHNDLARDGLNAREYALTTSNVNTNSFGKLFSCTVDGAIYAQPLWVANLTVNNATHNVVFVATAHDGLYAFDSDASPCVQLWHASLIDPNHGGTGGETTVPSGTQGNAVGLGDGDLTPETGVTGTPVIDPATGTLYVVSKSLNSAGSSVYQRLHAIDVGTGNEKSGSPLAISATFPGSGDGGTTVRFDPRTENQRAGLALVNGKVYIAWGSHEDAPTFYGWLIAYTYNGSAFTRSSVLNAAPNRTEAGIWMSGGAPAADASGNLYVITGNGVFDATSQSAPNNDYGDSFLKLTSNLSVSQYFTPSDETSDFANNGDAGSGGAGILADLPAGSPVTHLLIGGGKDGNLYALNRDAMGGLGDANAWQKFEITGAIFATPALWGTHLYIAGVGGALTDFDLNPSTAKFSWGPSTVATSGGFGFPGITPSVSATGASHGIVWALDSSQYCTKQSPGCGPAVLHAYDASNVATELWNSSKVAKDAAGNAVKFTVPTVANGKVYVGTRGNNIGGPYASTSVSGELDVYGLKP